MKVFNKLLIYRLLIDTVGKIQFFLKNYFYLKILRFLEIILRMKTSLRIFLLICIDLIILVISLLITSILLSVDNLFYFRIYDYKLLLSLLLIAIPFYLFTGQYKELTRFIGTKYIYQILVRNIVVIFILQLFIPMPASVSFVLWTFASAISYTLRIFLRDIILKIEKRRNLLQNVFIYGAGAGGARLLSNINTDNSYSVKGFIDDDPSLWGRSILGIKIFSSNNLVKLIQDYNIKKILLAIPSISKNESKVILNKLNDLKVEVLQIPSLSDILKGKSKIDRLRPIKVEDLLGRDVVLPFNNLLSKDINDSSMMVTGAGGSIGAQLCREILIYKPKKLILFDLSEPSLYMIYSELKEEIEIQSNCEIIPILGSATNKSLVDKVIIDNNVSIIFHAAAYKHVPLVEINPLQGIENNILSTKVLCDSALKNNINKFVLISSDKAVRPTNLMGASKRISELIVQAFHQSTNNTNSSARTIFLMVRFGNVMNSSGSVIPLFKKQIKKGGPITLTHKEITRYFMTIKEACQLVMQASSLAKGGDVFLLDMGKPIKIKKIAEQMISLSGLTVKNISNPNGDIEIITTGLRLGEKLYEELLISSDSIATEHPLIFKAKEKFIQFEKLNLILEKLLKACYEQNLNNSLNCVSELVPEWDSKLYKNK